MVTDLGQARGRHQLQQIIAGLSERIARCSQFRAYAANVVCYEEKKTDQLLTRLAEANIHW